MRAHALRPLAVAGIVGIVVGVLVALVGRWWADGEVSRVGVFSSPPFSDGVVVRADLAANHWQLLWPAMTIGLVVGVVGGVALTLRRGGRRPLPAGWRGLIALASIGVVLGCAVGGALYVRAGSIDGTTSDEVTYHGRYVPISGPARQEQPAYGSSLTVTVDGQPANAVAFIAVCGGAGLGAGLITFAVVAVGRRRVGR